MAFTLANKITVARIVGVPFFVSSLLYYSPGKEYIRWIAIGLFLGIVFTDALDGYIARRFNQKTKVGAILDPLADKLLLISSFIFLYALDDKFDISLPSWLVVCVISRDIILLLGALIIYMMHSNLDVKPILIGKVTTFFQMVSILCVLLNLPFAMLIWYITFVLTLCSGVLYINQGIRLLH